MKTFEQYCKSIHLTPHSQCRISSEDCNRCELEWYKRKHKELETRIESLLEKDFANRKKLVEQNIQLASSANAWDKIIEILNDDNKGPTCKLQKIKEVVE